jgi:hypothetical protein
VSVERNVRPSMTVVTGTVTWAVKLFCWIVRVVPRLASAVVAPASSILLAR